LPSNKLFPFHLCSERQYSALKLRSQRGTRPSLFSTAEKDESSFTSISDAWSRRSEWEVGGSSRVTHLPFPAVMRSCNCVQSGALRGSVSKELLSRATSGHAIPVPRTGRSIICILGWLISYLTLSSTTFLSILANDQLDAQIFNTFITVLYMYMFRAISCSSSGGQVVLIQHLVSSLSVSDRPVHRTVTY